MYIIDQSTESTTIVLVGIVSGVTFVFLIIVICVLLICLIWRATKHKTHTENEDIVIEQPAYEYVQDISLNAEEVKVEANVCYDTAQKQQEPEYAAIESDASIVMTRLNEAYAATRSSSQVKGQAETDTDRQGGVSQDSPDNIRGQE